MAILLGIELTPKSEYHVLSLYSEQIDNIEFIVLIYTHIAADLSDNSNGGFFWEIEIYHPPAVLCQAKSIFFWEMGWVVCE